ncbi:MAG: CBS domain-containing protein [Planctomycetota bacterium]|jgi:CBS domain-containing protein|nr:CBS domain-containing protein [Planctomycetota bacterium]
MVEKVSANQEARTTVRTLLSWFGMYRRGYYNVQRIRWALDQAGVVTVPDFEAAYIDGSIAFKTKEAVGASSDEGTQEASSQDEVGTGGEATSTLSMLKPVKLADAAHRISRLESANKQPVSIPPDATVEQAITLMLRYDYSQLPVMISPDAREAKGLFSWKSLGSRLAIGKQCAYVRESMDPCQMISSGASLFDAIKIIAQDDCVLVRADDNRICGIVTAYDISAQFQQLAESFLLLGDIENHIRHLIGNAFTVEELQQAKDPTDTDREVNNASNLSIGEYIRLLQKPANWEKLNIKIHRKTFMDGLEKIRIIRNDVMHFDPDPMDPADLKALADFARFLARWHKLTAKT